ncbi:major facilitator superfamily domain-containing protein 4A isoform X2 [Tetranychus urticae]|uniref:major facilitator superfamily domain-containing protein 4A isoform X2 n=1 Tax=Tetranychus urticae TaxID=32264 RepID=UPI000D65BECC|nr:major facilitator superfamily domain-containing protein 4A isoform X2 [Tetranychus urticae]
MLCTNKGELEEKVKVNCHQIIRRTRIRMSETFAVTSNLVPSRSIGYLIGGIISGIIGRWLGFNMILFISNFSAGLFIALAPWFTSFYTVYSLFLLSGISQGIFDITCNTYILQIWKGNPQLSNYIQILHGSFGIGSLLTPLITQPFLLPLNETTNGTKDDAAILGSYKPDDVKVQYPFLCVGFFLIIASVGFLSFHFNERSKKGSNSDSDENTSNSNDPPNWKKYCGIAMLSIIANLTFGIQTLIGSLGPSFAVKSELHMSKQTGATLVTIFWSVFTCYRIIFIISSNFIHENHLMWISYASLLASVVVSVPHAAWNQLCIWITMVLLGIGFSPLFTVSLSRLQKYFLLSNSLASFIFINGSVGESIHPWIASKLMESDPVLFVYYLGFLSSLFVFTCFIVPIICERIFRTEKKRDNTRTASIRSWTR